MTGAAGLVIGVAPTFRSAVHVTPRNLAFTPLIVGIAGLVLVEAWTP